MRMEVLGWQGRNGGGGIAASGMQHWDFSIIFAALGHDSKRMAAPVKQHADGSIEMAESGWQPEAISMRSQHDDGSVRIGHWE